MLEPFARVFYVTILPLVAFYALFATVLYPAAAYLHPHGMYEALAAHFPVGLHGLLKVRVQLPPPFPIPVESEKNYKRKIIGLDHSRGRNSWGGISISIACGGAHLNNKVQHGSRAMKVTGR